MNYFIFGSGPAGLGLAKHLLKKTTINNNVFLLENKVLTGGLLWTGVSPDHIEIK